MTGPQRAGRRQVTERESGIANATLPVEVVDAHRNAVMLRFLVVEG